jgi:hypothetical protein
MQRWSLLALLVLALSLTGCDNPQRTADTLRNEIAAFKISPDPKKQAEIEANFSKLDQQINQLETKDTTKADLLRRQYVNLQAEYQAAKLAKTVNDVKNAVEGIGNAFKEGAKSFGETLKNTGTSD